MQRKSVYISIRRLSPDVARLHFKKCNQHIFISVFYNEVKQEANLFTVPVAFTNLP